jgi:hypothetical protein
VLELAAAAIWQQGQAAVQLVLLLGLELGQQGTKQQQQQQGVVACKHHVVLVLLLGSC